MANIMRVGGGGGVNQFKLKIQYPDGVSDITCNLCGEDGSLTEIFEGQVLSAGQIIHTSTTEEGFSGNVYYVPAVTDEFVVTVGTHLNATTFSNKLDDYSWEEIIYFANIGVASDMFEVGDTKKVQLLDGNETEFRLVGILHDDNADQTAKLQLTFNSSILYPTTYQYHSTATYGGYLNYDICTTYMPQILANFPTILQGGMKCPYKYYDREVSTTSYYLGTFNNQKLWLPGQYELMGVKGYKRVSTEEGEQYAYYRDTEDLRFKTASGDTYASAPTRCDAYVTQWDYGKAVCMLGINTLYGYAYVDYTYKYNTYHYCLGFCL